MTGKKTAMAWFEVLSQKLPEMDCEKPRETSDYSVPDARFGMGPPNTKNSEALHLFVLTGCCGLTWSMLRPQKDVTVTWIYSPLDLTFPWTASVDSHEESVSNNDAILSVSDEHSGWFSMRQRKAEWKCNSRRGVGNLDGRPHHSWDSFPSLCYSGEEEGG